MGPTLLSKGEEYILHVFDGSVRPPSTSSVQRTRAGKVLVHTDTNTGNAKWIIQTGLMEVPTVRKSTHIFRLVGLLLTDTHIVIVLYLDTIHGRRPLPPVLSPDRGGYRVIIFEKQSGNKQSSHRLDLSDGKPAQVPEETTEHGVIQKTDRGFTVFGTSFAVHEDGSIRREPAPQP